MTNDATELAILFADISDSTALYEALGDPAAHELVAATLSRLSAIAERHGGTVVKTIGDEVMCTFEAAERAAAAACDMQEVMEERNEATHTGVVISVRIGFHQGPAIIEADDVHGDSVNVAARMVTQAKARQIVLPRSVAARLNASLCRSTRFVDYTTIRGKGEIELVELLWEHDDLTDIAGPTAVPPGEVRNVLHLRYRGREVVLDERRTVVVLGRKRICDLRVDEPLASRQHVRIERRSDQFFIVDQSTNGTYLRMGASEDRFLRREEWPLTGDAVISLGRDLREDPAEVVELFLETR